MAVPVAAAVAVAGCGVLWQVSVAGEAALDDSASPPPTPKGLQTRDEQKTFALAMPFGAGGCTRSSALKAS